MQWGVVEKWWDYDRIVKRLVVLRNDWIVPVVTMVLGRVVLTAMRVAVRMWDGEMGGVAEFSEVMVRDSVSLFSRSSSCSDRNGYDTMSNPRVLNTFSNGVAMIEGEVKHCRVERKRLEYIENETLSFTYHIYSIYIISLCQFHYCPLCILI